MTVTSKMIAAGNASGPRLAELDTFRGDNEHLRRSVIVLLGLAQDDALTPKVPGMALSLLAAAANRLGNLNAEMESFREIEAEAVKLGYPSLLEAVEELERKAEPLLTTTWLLKRMRQMKSALQQITQLRPPGDLNTAKSTRKLVEQMECIALAALADGRG